MRRMRKIKKNRRMIHTTIGMTLGLLLIMTIGYAAFSTTLNLTAKGTIKKIEIAYDNGTIIYFDPELNQGCTESDYNSNTGASDTGHKTGCMKWYAFNDTDKKETLNVILDHNTTARVAWNASGDSGDGPLLLNSQLASDITTWDSDVKSVARIIKAMEIAQITGNNTWNPSGTIFYFDSNTGTQSSTCTNDVDISGCNYGWLYDRTYATCENWGCLNNATGTHSGTGYWTDTPRANNNAWGPTYVGRMSTLTTSSAGSWGVRPVIEIDKSLIDENNIGGGHGGTPMGPGGTLKVAGGNYNSSSWFGLYIDKCNIKTLTLKTDMVAPNNVEDTYDIGVEPGTVTLWIDSSGNATIGTDGMIVANADSSNLFHAIGGYYPNETEIYGLENLDTSNVTDMSFMFSHSYFTNLDLSSFDTSNVTNMHGMFMDEDDGKLISLNLSGWDTSKVTNMANMFNSLWSLTTLIGVENWDTSNVTDMSYMFGSNFSTNSLTTLDLSSWDTSKVTNMYGMFANMSSLTTLDLGGWDTSKVTSMGGMFSGTSGLTSLDLSSFDTSSVTNMQGMFGSARSLTSLDVSSFDTSKVIFMDSMFEGMDKITTLDLSGFNTSNVVNMQAMFYKMTSVTNLNLSGWDTSNVTNMASMFRNMASLTSVDFRNATFAKVTNSSSMFTGTKTGSTIYTKDNTTKTWLQDASRYPSGNYIIP